MASTSGAEQPLKETSSLGFLRTNGAVNFVVIGRVRPAVYNSTPKELVLWVDKVEGEVSPSPGYKVKYRPL